MRNIHTQVYESHMYLSDTFKQANVLFGFTILKCPLTE
jgi:hypothetical protein